MHRPRPLEHRSVVYSRPPALRGPASASLVFLCAPHPESLRRAKDTQQPSGEHAFLGWDFVTVPTGPHSSRLLRGIAHSLEKQAKLRDQQLQLRTGQTVSVCDCVSACVYVVVFETIVLI